MLFADSCVVSELPVLAAPGTDDDPVRRSSACFGLIVKKLFA